MKIKISQVILVLSLVLFSSPAVAAPTGSAAPDFKLPNTDGVTISLSGFKGKIVVLEWFNAACPFVKKHYNKNDMQDLQKKWTEKGVIWLAIDSTNKEHKNYENIESLKKIFSDKKISANHLLADPEGKVGAIYSAKTTPHMFIINKEGNIAYQGAIDNNPDPFSDPKAAKNYVDAALTELTAGKEIKNSEQKPYGCSVKYK